MTQKSIQESADKSRLAEQDLVTAFDCRPPLGQLYQMVPDGESFWVFAYGSLVWRPGFRYIDSAKVTLLGYRRSLCIHSWHHRGTRCNPGLVFGLKAEGQCQGMAFLVEASQREMVLDYLYDRELLTYCYEPMRLPIRFSDGETGNALTFVANPKDPQYVDDMSIQGAAQIVSHAHGKSGANHDYVLNTWSHLQQLDIRDEWLDQLVDLLPQAAV